MFFRKRTPSSEPQARSLLDWAALSLLAEFPPATGNAALDAHNDAVVGVQAYLNGRAIAAESDEEKAYLLRLRGDLNCLHLTPPPTADANDTGDYS